MLSVSSPVKRLASFALIVGLLATPGVILAESAADCDARAHRAEMDAGGVGGGVARGAARGAIFGGIVGGSKSAKHGAALGVVVGGARRSAARSDIYRHTYDSCMAVR